MNRKILAIDDEPHMLVLLERIVREKTPHGITTTSNPLEVPELLGHEEFDLIITDLRMPKLDGLDLLRQIQEQGRRELVVMITAFGTDETALEARSLGVFDYISKPFRKGDILLCVDRAIKYQEEREQIRRLQTLLDREPYENAETGFRQEYARHQLGRNDGDVTAAASATGLPEEAFRELEEGE